MDHEVNSFEKKNLMVNNYSLTVQHFYSWGICKLKLISISSSSLLEWLWSKNLITNVGDNGERELFIHCM